MDSSLFHTNWPLPVLRKKSWSHDSLGSWAVRTAAWSCILQSHAYQMQMRCFEACQSLGSRSCDLYPKRVSLLVTAEAAQKSAYDVHPAVLWCCVKAPWWSVAAAIFAPPSPRPALSLSRLTSKQPPATSHQPLQSPI